MEKEKVIRILEAELELATGCTEPAAIAFTAATAAAHLKARPITKLVVRASGNIIKNAMAAGIPGTTYTGMEYAAAIGALGGDPLRKLEVINGVGQEVYREAERFVREKRVTIEVAEDVDKLFVDISVEGGGHRARAIISGNHTNVVSIEEEGGQVFVSNSSLNSGAVSPEEIRDLLSVRKIYEFVMDLDTEKDRLNIIRESISINSAISEEGLKNDYGLKIGKMIREQIGNGIVTDSMITNAVYVTTAGADARMAGAPLSVVANSGSGNQGITATMPVVAVAKWIKCDDDKLIRAVTLSNLIAIYIKSKFGRLSALCGATVAGTGAACGVAFLLGGQLKAVEYSIQNMIGNVTGMLCDGAKADCALKIWTCTNAAMQAALMALKGTRVQSTDGIVDEDVEKSIDNFTRLGNGGSSSMDPYILSMMLNKEGSR
jgi:L-cysteine desulfidase